MTTSSQLAQRLAVALDASGLTRQQLTEHAGVSRQALYRLLKGQDVQLSTVLAVMDALGVDLALVPRGLRRGLPELDLNDVIPDNLGGFVAEPAAPGHGSSKTGGPAKRASTLAASPRIPAPVAAHAPSAVQRRLAALKTRKAER
ncbi:hypothetical protein CDN99_11970 [Roseateles aquatilis]|uniref:HTH cro/C1-type domain-containing protein n=1 Tax=Roseateles aquatilis TaxID=431061 RepID=A0A246JE80_9BURK|nr:helix-turn-helix transcriptional regulator [Roseateles aquatilis]OWQ90871.1 hypothetical protein CDN99_11970 [Roseateles aquatilis]